MLHGKWVTPADRARARGRAAREQAAPAGWCGWRRSSLGEGVGRRTSQHHSLGALKGERALDGSDAVAVEVGAIGRLDAE